MTDYINKNTLFWTTSLQIRKYNIQYINIIIIKDEITLKKLEK